MRFVTVQAYAFGPLADRTLLLSPGFNVIAGANESGKSSWHAAMYAGLCGVRRGPGKRKPAREFALRHKPWHDDRWEVTVIIKLDDGREITIHQDLAGKVDSRATDRRGRDVSNDIIYEGSPDGARWLGLNRETFLATACVRQTDVLGVLEDPQLLQTTLQAAAATATIDTTAAAAIERIETYHKEHVGLDRTNSRRPLRLAKVRLEEAKDALRLAEEAHREFLDLSVRWQDLRSSAAAADLKARMAEARIADTAATTAESRAAKAEDLSSKFPDGQPEPMAATDELGREVASVIRAWEDRPSVPDLEGPTADELAEHLSALPEEPIGDWEPHSSVVESHNELVAAQARLDALGEATTEELIKQIEALPSPPDGDIEPSQEVEAAYVSYSRAEAAVEASMAEAPDDPEDVGYTDVEPRELRELADNLDRPIPQTAENSEEALRVATAELQELQGPSTTYRTTMIAGAVVAVGGLALALVSGAAGAVLIAFGLLGVGFGAWKQSDRKSRRVESLATIASIEAKMTPDRHRAAEVRDHRQSASRRLTDLGIAADPQEVRALADRIADCGAAVRRHGDWARRQTQLESRMSQTSADFFSALESRGESTDPSADPAEAAKAYRDGCRQRSHEAQGAAKRATLEAELVELRKREGLLREAEVAFLDTLARRDDEVIAGADLEDLYAGYRQRCKQRARQAAESSRRGDLEAQLRERQNTETARNESIKKRDAMDESLRVVSERCGLGLEPGPELIESLRNWQSDRTAELKQRDKALHDWADLDALLDGRTLPELIDAARQQRDRAHRLRDDLAGAPTDLDAPLPDQPMLRHLRDEAKALREEAALAEGIVKERSASLPSVPEAEVKLKAATDELRRVEQLEATLTTTLDFLREAEDKVNRSIAPVLSKSMAPRLPLITDGRYSDVRVDPETLRVEVCAPNGHWRQATGLSTGTAEQIYLLLRTAMAENLVTTPESCPLILDDVTVQSDAERTARIMEALHDASADRQVILFTQEDEVATWAVANLLGDADSYQELDPAVISP